MPIQFMLNQTLLLQLVRAQNPAMPARTVSIANIAQKMEAPVVFVGKMSQFKYYNS